MNTLEKLKKLDSHIQKLSQFENKLKELNNNRAIKDLQIKLNNMEGIYTKQRTRLEDTKENIRNLENKLRNQEFLHKEKKKLLYQGDIIDIKQLEQLDIEEKEIKGFIDSIEIKIINNLQEVDLMEEELNKIQREFDSIKINIQKQIQESQIEIEQLEKNIFKERNYITSLSSEIDKSSLELYEKIRSQKINPIVALKGDICSGCNMKIPRYQKNMVLEGSEIIVCESCGRILYIEAF